jgi:outer membrane lipoprotein SlyB
MKFCRTFFLLLLAVTVAGCASSRSGNVYSRDQARTTHTVEMGTVVKVDQVQIEGTKSGAGVLAGAATGGAIGSTIGSGGGRTVGTVLGAVVGGLAGAGVEESVTRKAGLEITVNLDSGRTIVVVQEADEVFQANDRVRVLEGSDGTTRVRH